MGEREYVCPQRAKTWRLFTQSSKKSLDLFSSPLLLPPLPLFQCADFLQRNTIIFNTVEPQYNGYSVRQPPSSSPK